MFHSSVYVERRKKLRSLLNEGIVLIPGNVDSPMNYPANAYKFRQDSNFLYFFGLDLENLIGVLDLDNGEDILFGNDVDIEDIIWMGPQPSIRELGQKVGITKTSSHSELFSYIEKAISSGRKVHFLPPYRAENKLLLQSLTGIEPKHQKAYASLALIKAVISLRSVKEEVEIIEIEKAISIGHEMHTTAMRMAKPGIYEMEIAGVMEGIAMKHGGQVSFPIILSVHGETLHNHYHGNLLTEGRMLLIDAGAENISHYASDHTRTIPVGGKFNSRQKDIYEIVLKANMDAIAAIKPGVPYRDVHLLSARTIIEGLKALGLMKGDTHEAAEKGAHALFFPHGLGHMMGLDVHDMEDMGENYVGYDEEIKRSTLFGTASLRLGKRLKEGYVLTVEPGIYFIPELYSQWKQEKMFNEFINYSKVESYLDFGGVRIEDDVLVTAGGNRVLGKSIPKSVSEVEDYMKTK